MTAAELFEWGRQEHQIRLDDMARVHAGTLSLAEAQESASLRARRGGLTISVADRALRLARVARS